MGPNPIENKMRVCRTCGEGKSLDKFKRSKKGRFGYGNECKPCFNKRNRLSGAKAVQKAWQLRTKFGITPVWYLAQYRHQNGKCAICKELAGNKTMAVDHDHETGNPRGLLCIRCNALIAGATVMHRIVLQSALNYISIR